MRLAKRCDAAARHRQGRDARGRGEPRPDRGGDRPSTGEAPEVCHAIEAHHGEVEQRTIEAVITQTADAISGARPGARRETLETYVKRLERLESIAMEFDGVEKVYAMQAGREVRVMVKPENVDDLQAEVIARDIAKKVEEELQYPGQIRITVIRELRSSALAK